MLPPDPASMRCALLLVLVLLASCDVNPFDDAEQPRVRVDVLDGVPVFSWTPQGARSLDVFEGAGVTDALDGARVWSVTAADGENGMRSPVSYGVVPDGGVAGVAAQPLVAGRPYTVYVHRDDPRGTGDGFTNTNNRYADAKTFVP